MLNTELLDYIKQERGRNRRLAVALEVTEGAVSQWARSRVPSRRMMKLSRLTGIPVHKLRPDLVNKKGEWL